MKVVERGEGGEKPEKIVIPAVFQVFTFLDYKQNFQSVPYIFFDLLNFIFQMVFSCFPSSCMRLVEQYLL